MGIVNFHLASPHRAALLRSALAAPVQALAHWIRLATQRPTATVGRHAPAPSTRFTAVPHSASPVSPIAGKATCHRAPPKLALPCKSPTVSRLKIVREFDATMSPASAGRMMISGRMADVCAELERLTQLEAAGR